MKKKKGKIDKSAPLSIMVLILMLVIGGLTVYFGLRGNNHSGEGEANQEQIVSNPDTIAPELVCMVNDRYMGVNQMPVEVDSKIYYGCCMGCVDKIKNNVQNVRFDSDPLTGEKVDKATAYIVMNPNGSGQVMYFKTKSNYIKFKNQQP